MFLSQLTAAASWLRIDEQYLADVAARVGVAAPRPKHARSLEGLLDRVATANLFDHEFNAFVSGGTVVEGVPAVCVYPHLLGSTAELIDVVAPSYRCRRRGRA